MAQTELPSFLQNKWIIPITLFICLTFVPYLTVIVTALLLLTIRQKPISSPLNWPILGVIGVLGVSIIFSVDPPAGVHHLFQFLCVVLIFYIAYTQASFQNVLGGLLVATTLLMIMGVAEWLLFQPARVRAFGSSPNITGFFLALGILIALHKKNWWLTIAFVMVLLLTGSRTALMALLAGVLIQNRRWWLPAGVLFGLGLAFMVWLRPYILEMNPEQFRFIFWGVAWDMFLQDPLTGMGLGTFGQFWHTAYPDRLPYLAAHSLWATLLSETGLLGIVATLWFIWKSYQSTPAGDYTLLHSFFASFFVHVFWDTPEYEVLALLFILLALRLKPLEPSHPLPPQKTTLQAKET